MASLGILPHTSVRPQEIERDLVKHHKETEEGLGTLTNVRGLVGLIISIENASGNHKFTFLNVFFVQRRHFSSTTWHEPAMDLKGN